jgi:hypothetical protein
MLNPFALVVYIIIIICIVKKRKLSYLGFSEDGIVKRSKIIKWTLPLVGIAISLIAFFYTTVDFYIPLFNQLK